MGIEKNYNNFSNKDSFAVPLEIVRPEIKEKFNQIWDLALPYQDKRDDEGHAESVSQFVSKLVEIEKANENIAVPAAILHDIGWSKVPKEEAMKNFGNKIGNNAKIELQKKHEEIGVEMAREILEKVNYDTVMMNEILEIISGHDTREEFISKNEGIVRDADKLWRFSNKGFWLDVKRGSYTPEERYEMLKEKINSSNFFYSKSAKKIAQEKLEKRKLEIKEKNIR